MVIIEPVIESCDAKGFGGWPIRTDLDSEFLVLSGELTSAEVGTVMAVIAVYNHNRIAPSGEEDEHLSPARLIQGIIQADSLIAPDGLRVRDTATGLAVSPSCCCGLEGWREWSQVALGQSPWLGHTPAPWVEHLDHKIRVWPDGGDEAVPPAGTLPIEIPASDFPCLIASANEQLSDFLDLLQPWATPLAGTTARDPGLALAAHFHVDWPAPGSG